MRFFDLGPPSISSVRYSSYSLYHSEVSKHRFSLRFDDEVLPQRRGRGRKGCVELVAPPELQREMTALIRFKSSTLTEMGYQRSGVWGEETAAQRGEHLSLLFGALAAPESGEVRGLGVRIEDLSFAHLVFPAVWDWYVQWRERRRGFFTGCRRLHYRWQSSRAGFTVLR